MSYLHVTEACLKVIIAMFYFCHSNHSSNIIFLIPSLYIFEKKFLVNKYNKQMCYKEKNKSLQKLKLNFNLNLDFDCKEI